jgi:Flp pilus assembly protein TadG
MKPVSLWQKWLRDERGNVLILAALSMTALMGFVAMATDVGLLFRSRRNVQIAADAAAMAGALDVLYNRSVSSAQAAGKAASSANGFADVSDGGTATVSVTTPPADGPNAGSAGFVEAVVSAPRNTFFMAMFGFKTMTVSARAVAGDPVAGQACIWLMAPSGNGLNLQGSYDIEAPSCGVYVNSNTSDALNVTGGAGRFNAKFLDVVGNSILQHTTTPTAPTMKAPPRKSPWGNINGPDPSTGKGCDFIDSTTTTLSGNIAGPGKGKTICYKNAVTINDATFGTGTLGTSIGTSVVTSSAGTLVFGNDVTVTTGSTVTVFGGTLDFNNGSFSQNSNSTVNVISPRSGAYNGIAIMEPASNTGSQCPKGGGNTPPSPCLQVQFGSNNQVLDGYIFAPATNVYLQDSGGGINATGIVAKTMYNKTSQITIPSYDAAHPSTTVNRVVTLVE